jgi:hypothetical protein
LGIRREIERHFDICLCIILLLKQGKLLGADLFGSDQTLPVQSLGKSFKQAFECQTKLSMLLLALDGGHCPARNWRLGFL